MLKTIWIIAQREFRVALHNRWFLLYTLIFAGLALALSMLSRPDVEFTQLAEYNRTVASLVNLVLLFVPLIGLTFGATSLASERETGVLNYLLAQPVTRSEVLIGKYLGTSAALLASLMFSFGVAGVILSLQGGGENASGYAITVGIACLLALAMLSLGFFISALSEKTASALGGALFIWLVLVFLGDLGLIGASIIAELPLQTTLLLAMINPLQLFKMGAIFSAHTSLDVLGPAGLYATDTFGNAFMAVVLAGMILWIVLPMVMAHLIFARHQEAL